MCTPRTLFCRLFLKICFLLLRYGRLKYSKMTAGRHLEFDPTGNGAVGSAVPEHPTIEPNTKSIG